MILTKEEQEFIYRHGFSSIPFLKIMIFTQEEQELIIDLEKINKMTHYEMAFCIRYASVGHKYLDINKPFYKWFKKRFCGFGGMTSKISQQVGWWN